jgi:hypothetical protein
MMEKPLPSMGHSFSIEMASKINLSELSISGEPMGVLVEGDLGEHIHLEVVEGIMLDLGRERRVPP